MTMERCRILLRIMISGLMCGKKNCQRSKKRVKKGEKMQGVVETVVIYLYICGWIMFVAADRFSHQRHQLTCDTHAHPHSGQCCKVKYTYGQSAIIHATQSTQAAWTLVNRESYWAHAFCANKRFRQQPTMAIVPFWFQGIKAWLGRSLAEEPSSKC